MIWQDDRTWRTWQRGDDDERRKEVWKLHQETHLDDTLRALIRETGQPEAVMIRRLG